MNDETNIKPSKRKLFLWISIGAIILILIYVWYTGAHCMLRSNTSRMPYFCIGPCYPYVPREGCYESIAKSDINFNCKRIVALNENYFSEEFYLRRCFEDRASKNKNPDICLDYSGKNARNCVYAFAVANKDSSICLKYDFAWKEGNEGISLSFCIKESGGKNTLEICQSLDNEYDKKACYTTITQDMNDNCEIILNFDIPEKEKEYLECIKRDAEQSNNLDICRSCEGVVFNCNNYFIANCYAYTGFYSDSVEPCFYKNYLFSIDYTYWNQFIDCYDAVSKSASSPFKTDVQDEMINYLQNYCNLIPASKEKTNCEISLNYLTGQRDCGDRYWSVDINKYNECISKVSITGR